MATDRLHEWQEYMGLKGSLKDTAINKIAHDLNNHRLYVMLSIKTRIIQFMPTIQ